MAKLVAPYGAAEARGKVNGVIFNVWRGIQYIKKWTSPANPGTARQLLVRGYVTTLSRAWSALTPVQRDGWTAWAAAHPVADWTGIPKRTTGLNCFLRMNSILLDLGSAVVNTAPVVAAPPAVVALAAADGVGQSIVTWTTPGGTSYKCDIWGYRLGSAAVVPRVIRAVHKAYVNAETATYTLTGLSPGSWAIFARNINEGDGQVSVLNVDVATIT